MFAIVRNVIAATHFQRIGERYISSVVPELNLSDFGIKNEPILSYTKGSQERKQLEESLVKIASKTEDVPIIIGGEEIRTNEVRHQVMPHNHSHKLATFYYADKKTIQKAIDTAVSTQAKWDRTPLDERLGIWLRANIARN